ncbi:MAG: RluA family pseudouridine synthase [Treponema sp.]|nr:RluA family pseudouridine synthase [Treponema sp.]
MNLLPILYENDEVIVINKPSGLAVQGGEGIHHSLDKDFSLQLGYKIYLVHRLDKDTAGLMIVAKNPLAASKWTKLIASKEVQKEYAAICYGCISPEKGTIIESVIQHGVKKEAKTHYSLERKFNFSFETEEIQLSRINLKLETGRMHQIRIHLSKNGCPIAGDEQHGNFKMNKILRKKLGIKKLLLASVKLQLPLDGKIKTFSIDLPDYMNDTYFEALLNLDRL